MNYQTPSEYAEVIQSLTLIGPMSAEELAILFSVPKPRMSNWIFRMRKQENPVAIVGWEKTGGNRVAIYGIGTEDVPQPPVDTPAMKRAWYERNVVTARGKHGTPKRVLRLNNLFGVSFKETA